MYENLNRGNNYSIFHNIISGSDPGLMARLKSEQKNNLTGITFGIMTQDKEIQHCIKFIKTEPLSL